MSYKKVKTRGSSKTPKIDFTDKKKSETLNIRVSVATYTIVRGMAEKQNIPMSEYARFLIEWHLQPGIILTNLMHGAYSPEEDKESITAWENRLNRLLNDIENVKAIEKWVFVLKNQIENTKEHINTLLSGGSITDLKNLINKSYEEINLMEEYLNFETKKKQKHKEK